MLIDTHCHIHDRELYAGVVARQKGAGATPRKVAGADTGAAEPGKSAKSVPEADTGAAEAVKAPSEAGGEFTPERMLAAARVAGVEKVVTIGTNHADSLGAGEFARKWNGESGVEVNWSYGVHPEYAGEFRGVEFSGIDGGGCGGAERDTGGRLVAIGEVGLDYHYPEYDRAAQIRLLEAMVDLAQRLDLPLIFHVREAFEDFFPVLANFSATGGRKRVRGVVHSFSDSAKNLQKCLDADFYIGVNGLATFAPIPLPPLERMLLETDAPFLTPVPHRGRVNQPAEVRAVAEFVAGSSGSGADFRGGAGISGGGGLGVAGGESLGAEAGVTGGREGRAKVAGGESLGIEVGEGFLAEVERMTTRNAREVFGI